MTVIIMDSSFNGNLELKGQNIIAIGLYLGLRIQSAKKNIVAFCREACSLPWADNKYYYMVNAIFKSATTARKP